MNPILLSPPEETAVIARNAGDCPQHVGQMWCQSASGQRLCVLDLIYRKRKRDGKEGLSFPPRCWADLAFVRGSLRHTIFRLNILLNKVFNKLEYSIMLNSSSAVRSSLQKEWCRSHAITITTTIQNSLRIETEHCVYTRCIYVPGVLSGIFYYRSMTLIQLCKCFLLESCWNVQIQDLTDELEASCLVWKWTRLGRRRERDRRGRLTEY